MDSKTFKRKLNALVKSVKTQRDNLQALIAAGLELYANNGDTAYLTDVAHACVGVKALPTTTITEYIKAHANVKWVKPAKEEGRFKKRESGVPAEVAKVDKPWYEWEGAKHNIIKEDIDEVVVVNMAIKRLEKAIQDGKAKNPKAAAQTLAQLRGIVA